VLNSIIFYQILKVAGSKLMKKEGLSKIFLLPSHIILVNIQAIKCQKKLYFTIAYHARIKFYGHFFS
jgi:hypothetical protein